MIKQDLITEVADITGRTEYETKMFVEALIDVMTRSLKKEEPIIIRGFGTFTIKERAPKLVANINTGERYVIGKKKVVTFRPGKELEIQ